MPKADNESNFLNPCRKSNTYHLALLVKSVELEELFFLLVVVVRTDEYDNENCEEDSEPLNPCYIIIIRYIQT